MALRLTEKQYSQLIQHGCFEESTHQNKKNKFRNTRCFFDNRWFDSAKERDRYIDLKLLERIGEITNLECQKRYQLIEAASIKGEKRKKPAIQYIADFTYIRTKDNSLIVEDVKSSATRRLPAYRQKKHMMKVIWGIDITET